MSWASYSDERSLTLGRFVARPGLRGGVDARPLKTKCGSMRRALLLCALVVRWHGLLQKAAHGREKITQRRGKITQRRRKNTQRRRKITQRRKIYPTSENTTFRIVVPQENSQVRGKFVVSSWFLVKSQRFK